MNEKTREPWKVFLSSPAGTGNWRRFDLPWERVSEATDQWQRLTQGHTKLWLCWNVNDAWCVLQQKLVSELGWTPVVGWDPMCGVSSPPLVEGAIGIDFGATLGVPGMFMHVPLELAFAWAPAKLAFWHSDLLLPRPKMLYLARIFDALQAGEVAAVFSYGGIRNILDVKAHRYWELCGCTTRAASKDQFDKGSGWWKNIAYHPNSSKDPEEQSRRQSLHNEHGVGIRYWEKRYGGKVIRISERKIADGHFSVTAKKDYKIAETKAEELDINFNLAEIALAFGINDLLDDSRP